MWRRKTTGVVALVLGVVLFIAAIIDHAFAAPKAALCGSGIGEIGQAIDNTVAHDCGLVTALASAVGWLLAAAILAALLGATVLYRSRPAPRSAPAAPAPHHPPRGPQAPTDPPRWPRP